MNKEENKEEKNLENIKPKSNEDSETKEIKKDPTPPKNEQAEINTNNDSTTSKHGKCVPLAVYQKVYDDKKKLITQLDLINNQLKSSISDDKINLVGSLQNEVKNLEREKKFLENIVIKQEKSINNLKNKINKYDSQLNKKNEELLKKDNIINELKEKIDELIENNKNIKNNFKLNEKSEIIKLNDIINNLKNELEIKDQKMEFNNIKFNNLQIKYLKLFQQKRKIENESLLKLSKEHLANTKAKNNYSTPKKNMKLMNTLSSNIDKNNELIKNLPLINDVNSSLSISKNNNGRYLKKKKILDNKESYSMTNND